MAFHLGEPDHLLADGAPDAGVALGAWRLRE